MADSSKAANPGASYKQIAAKVSDGMFHWVWTACFLAGLLFYVIALVVEKRGDYKKDEGADAMALVLKWVQIVAGQLPALLCCVLVYRKDWGARYVHPPSCIYYIARQARLV